MKKAHKSKKHCTPFSENENGILKGKVFCKGSKIDSFLKRIRMLDKEKKEKRIDNAFDSGLI